MILSVPMITIVFLVTAPAQVMPPVPVRIGGTVTVDGKKLSRFHDKGYAVTVAKPDGTLYSPNASDTDGLNTSDFYTIDIPVYDKDGQPGGARQDETAVIHVYKDGKELEVITPAKGKIVVGKSRSISRIDLVVITPSNVPLGPTSTTPNKEGTKGYVVTDEGADGQPKADFSGDK